MYVPRNSDLKHMFEDLAGFSDLVESGCFEDLSMDLVDAVLGEAGRFAAEGLAPSRVQRTDWTQETVINRAMQIVPQYQPLV